MAKKNPAILDQLDAKQAELDTTVETKKSDAVEYRELAKQAETDAGYYAKQQAAVAQARTILAEAGVNF